MRILRFVVALGLAASLWLSTLHRWFVRAPEEVGRPLIARQLALWQSDRGELEVELASLRRSNPEWDLMARMFAVLTFANESNGYDAYATAIDRVIARTLADYDRGGTQYWLLPYGRDKPFIDAEARSAFVEGEIAMMLAARYALTRNAAHGETARTWTDRVVAQIERGPAHLAESYPDEAWIFCNAVAVAAMRLVDAVDGVPERHAALVAKWVARARDLWSEPGSGLLVAKLDHAGRALEGPEGSTVWLVSAMLQIVDEDLAREQYTRARAELGGSFAGFGWAREWPATSPGHDDIDSGPTIPIIGASAGSSGLALIAARAFGDDEYANALIASLQLAAFPVDDGARYAAGNLLADAVIAYAMAGGSVRELVQRSSRRGAEGGAS